jgi:hypothetical protein
VVLHPSRERAPQASTLVAMSAKQQALDSWTLARKLKKDVETTFFSTYAVGSAQVRALGRQVTRWPMSFRPHRLKLSLKSEPPFVTSDTAVLIRQPQFVILGLSRRAGAAQERRSPPAGA